MFLKFALRMLKPKIELWLSGRALVLPEEKRLALIEKYGETALWDIHWALQETAIADVDHIIAT